MTYRTPPSKPTTALTRLQRVARWGPFAVFLSDFRWYRRQHGGRWECWWIGAPFDCRVWLPNESGELGRFGCPVAGERPALGDSCERVEVW